MLWTIDKSYNVKVSKSIVYYFEAKRLSKFFNDT